MCRRLGRREEAGVCGGGWGVGRRIGLGRRLGCGRRLDLGRRLDSGEEARLW